MPLQDMLGSAARGGSVEVEEGWTQGRALYGGLTGALLLAAVKGELTRHHGEDAASTPLRSFTVSFIGPATPGTVEASAEVLRAGSNVTQCQSTLRQGGELVATALASFGRHRESAITVEPPHPMPEMPDPATIEPVPYMEGFTPEFFRFMDLRLVHGNWPFTGSDTASITGWTALREQPDEFAAEHLLALADAWPPAVIQMLTEFAPASSLTWTVEFVSELGRGAVDPEGRFAYEVQTDAARDGYAHVHAMLWKPDGELVAISRQTITVFG